MEKGSTRTAIERGLVGSKKKGKPKVLLVGGKAEEVGNHFFCFLLLAKEKQVKIPAPDRSIVGRVSFRPRFGGETSNYERQRLHELRDGDHPPWKSFLFFADRAETAETV